MQASLRDQFTPAQEAAKGWLELDPDAKTRAEVEDLLEKAEAEVSAWESQPETAPDAPHVELLRKRFLQRVAFGTAGLRARMAAGYACLNTLVITQATQGLCEHLLESVKDAKAKGVVIGYDARYNSRSFAETTAAVLLSKGVKVHLFSRIVATPLVPYGVLKLSAAAGIMITASHNPKEDNGYKVYWDNGAQIIPPHDRCIATAIEKEENLRPWHDYAAQWDPDHALLECPDELIAVYMREAQERYSFSTREANAEAKVPITYTAMHGVGTYFVEQVFESFGLPPFIPVREQVEPDPEFSTVKFPNPEEGKGALKLSMETAEREGSRVILANDPDADRLAVAERDAETGEWRIFNGNQIAALFADWVWKNWTERNPDADRSQAVMLASTVSSKFLAAMAEKEGFCFIDTLTGFKWMGNVASDVIAEGRTFLFAYEVEIGFLVGDLSLDKDGVRTAAIFTELVNHLYSSGTSLFERLNALYAKYGYYEMNTSYFFCHTEEPLERVFGHLRTGGPDGGYVDSCGEHKITGIRDITTGYDSSTPDKKTTLPTMPDAHMITFRFDNGAVATMRNSGTEPKLKYYVECNDPESQANARSKVDAMTQLLISEFMKPDENGLIAKKVE